MQQLEWIFRELRWEKDSLLGGHIYMNIIEMTKLQEWRTD